MPFNGLGTAHALFIAGTDTTLHLTIAGFSLHDELQSLTRHGTTPAQALLAARVTPTQLMGTNADGLKRAGEPTYCC